MHLHIHSLYLSCYMILLTLSLIIRIISTNKQTHFIENFFENNSPADHTLYWSIKSAPSVWLTCIWSQQVRPFLFVVTGLYQFTGFDDQEQEMPEVADMCRTTSGYQKKLHCRQNSLHKDTYTAFNSIQKICGVTWHMAKSHLSLCIHSRRNSTATAVIL